MPSLKDIRKRIGSVKSTQKITRAMKMVAGARLNRAQHRILALRPYAVKTQDVLASVVAENDLQGNGPSILRHPLLVRREEKRVLYVLLTSDRGLCGSFNTTLNKAAERLWREGGQAGREVRFYVVGRKGRDYLRRRNAPITHFFTNVWDSLDLAQARRIGQTALAPFRRDEIDAIYLVYNQFKSAMSQVLTVERLLPVAPQAPAEGGGGERQGDRAAEPAEYLFEPDASSLLDRLVPMYVEISILRALLESQASELGARMTAMDSATKNAKDVIGALTLQYNRARQASITKELMEIIGGAEALKG